MKSRKALLTGIAANRTYLVAVTLIASGCIVLPGFARNDKAILRDAGGTIKKGKVVGVTRHGVGGQTIERGGGGKMKVDAVGKGVARGVRNPTEPGDTNGSTIITKVMGKPKIVKNGRGIRNLKQDVLARNPDFPVSPAEGTAKSRVDKQGSKWKWKTKVRTEQDFFGNIDVFTGTITGKG